MVAPLVPRSGTLLENRFLNRLGPSNGPLQSYLKRFASHSSRYFRDDFEGDAINLDNYALGNGAGSGAVAFAVVAQEGGAIDGICGTANGVTASQSLIMPITWYGDRNCGVEFIFKPSSIEEIKMEFGLIDAVPASTTAAVNNHTTPTFYAADAAVMYYNKTSSTVVNGFYTVGSTTDMPDDADAITSTISATVWNRVRVQLWGNNAACWLNGLLVAVKDNDAVGFVEGGVALSPWIYVRANSATSKTLSVDQIEAWSDRPALVA